MSKSELLDSCGRRINYVRLSITDRCNFRCVYCMPPDGETYIPHEEILSYEEILRLCRIMTDSGIEVFKITGGEPLCRKGAVRFIRNLKALPGVKQVTLTSNGVLLGPFVQELAQIGLDGLNISLDTLNQRNFQTMSRTKARPDQVIEALDMARRAGLKVKINAVPMRDVNTADLEELAAFALSRGYTLRFIELMPMGPGMEYEGVGQEEIKRMLTDRFGALAPLAERLGNGPAQYYRVEGYEGRVGFISALSDKFCASCNRVRLTSAGYLKSCLHHDIGIDLKKLLRCKADDTALAAAIGETIRKKPAAHAFAPEQGKIIRSTFLMNSVGG